MGLLLRRWLFGHGIIMAIINIATSTAAFVVPPTTHSTLLRSTNNNNNNNNNNDEDHYVAATIEVMRSLVDYHQGTWTGRARSFSVVPDTAAGIVQRKISPPYQLDVTLGGTDDDDDDDNNNDYRLLETFSWDKEQTPTTHQQRRSLPLSECNLDVDVVDASYSLDISLPNWPAEIIGTDDLSQFAIEHCISASEDKRMRCVILYGMDQKLQRVVVCEETRSSSSSSSRGRGGRKHGSSQSRSHDDDEDDKSTIQAQMQVASESKVGNNNNNQLSIKDFLEMENDVDRLVDKIAQNLKTDSNQKAIDTPQGPTLSMPTDEQFQTSADSLLEKLGKSMASSTTANDSTRTLTLHDLSLLEFSSGVWLGDAIIRNHPHGADGRTSPRSGLGFAIPVQPSSSSSSSAKPTKQELASWSVGVQKLAWRLMWNFGEEIRQVVDAGKALGDTLATCLTQSTGGNVCVNESLSRRMAKEDRMVYIDWTASNSVGFLVGPTCIYVPRYLNFEQKGSNPKPFYTEFALCQSTPAGNGNDGKQESLPRLGAEVDEEESLQFPVLCLSRSSRVYNHEGRLKQGCTSFFTFKRFGVDDDDDVDE